SLAANGGCPLLSFLFPPTAGPEPGPGPGEEPEVNTTDPTNDGASYIGSAACAACHADVAAAHWLHGHAHKLTKLEDTEGPQFPTQATRAGVPNPPTGKTWADITYVIGGYHRKARFVNNQGYVMTDGVDGVNTQWNLDFPATGTVAGWTSYHADQVNPKPYSFSCFQCHTTGPSEEGHQDSLEGIVGTFAEPGIQCEACHGPGSNHVAFEPDITKIYVNEEASECGACHSRGDDMDVIPASSGYVKHHEQYQELLASPHKNLDCVSCHDPHTSVTYDEDNAIIADCESCHAGQNMALHSNKVFVRGDYVEALHCESCHMPFAAKSAAAAGPSVVGAVGRMGDIRSHIFWINTSPVDFNSMFSADGGSVQKDADGNAAVTVDFVCLRCHNGIGNAFELSVAAASSIARDMHE
ncbi:MAG: multiheme c-type cytochrome, partial [Phycisphaerae bacterium]